jgi:hypothetical protein
MYWITGLVGLALMVAPFILSYNTDLVATSSSVGLGAFTVLVSIIKGAIRDVDRWEYWVIVFVGLLAIVAPFALGFRMQVGPLDASVILGVIAIVLAGYQILTHSPTQ